MSKTKILIVEDEPIIASDVEMILEDLAYEVTGIEDNAIDAKTSIETNRPDLIFLDINLEGDEDGIMLAQDINENYRIPFIFLTSNTDIQTINRVKRTKPKGFIVKPFSEKDFKPVIEIALFSSNNTKEKIATQPDSFFVKTTNGLVKINTNEIFYIQADDNYSAIITSSKKHLVSLTLKKVDEKLSQSNFIRVHRSFIININFINKIKDGFVYIGKKEIPIGRSYQEYLFSKISRL
ncbi:MAG: LytTR family transcriptional regulator DNA-binding domain-containing protein [Bacteroidales bacterium]|nr:LytTR family transcriptional regulator DNA-binding domain-containing protein [Bacteroidales bacterium]